MFKTIQKNLRHIACVQDMMQILVKDLSMRLLCHDRSKFSEDEMKGYVRFEDFPEGLEYGSPEHKAAMAKVMENNDCFEIHCTRNDHHPEHYENDSDMPLPAVIEMVCDWAGATLSYGNSGSWMKSVEHNIARHDFSEGQEWVIRQHAEYLHDRVPELQEKWYAESLDEHLRESEDPNA